MDEQNNPRTPSIPDHEQWTERDEDGVHMLKLLRALANVGRQGLYPDGSLPDTKVFRLRTTATHFLPWLRHYTVQKMAPRTFFESDPHFKLDPVSVPEAITEPIVLRQGGILHNGDDTAPVPCLIRYEISQVAPELMELEIRNWAWETWLDFDYLCKQITVTFPHEVSERQTPTATAPHFHEEKAQVIEPMPPKEPVRTGMKIGTDERVRRMHGLLKAGWSFRRAEKEAHSTTTTYRQRCREATGEDPIEPYR